VADPIKKSTERVAAAVEEVEKSTDGTTVLAADRTIFAAERTYAAWVRTGLAALAAGVGAKAVLGPVMGEALVLAAGSVLILFSVFCFEVGVWRELFSRCSASAAGRPKDAGSPLICVNGFLMLVALAALLGVWLARTPGQ
jgi:inner membrane protein YidH